MTGDTPDWRPATRGRVRAHRLAQAAQAHPAPVRLETGHFAPPNTYAVWHLPLTDGAVLQLVWRESDDAVVTRFIASQTDGECARES